MTNNRRQEQIRAGHLAQIVDQSPAVIYAYDLEGRFSLVNPRFLDLLGFEDSSDVLGRTPRELFPPEFAAEVTANNQAVLEAGSAIEFEETIPLPDGSSRTYLSVKFPLRDDAGDPDGLVGISTDITARKSAWDEVERLRHRAEQANRAKSTFLSRMSHELRTPLNSILGFGQLLEMSDLDEEDADAVHHILKSGRHLLRLIDEVLDISRIETGRMSLSVEPVNITTTTRESMGLMRTMASDRGIQFEFEVSPSATGRDGYVLADHQRLQQILLNLLSNAVKYNREGGRVTVRISETDEGCVRLAVTDTGFGVPEGQVHRLFEPFDRLGAESTSTEGTGLGLALSRSLAEAMGGVMGVDNEPGQGSTFWLELPRPRPQDVPDLDGDEPSPNGDAGRTIVYIEDNEPNIRVVERALARVDDVRVLTSLQGRIGLDLVREHQPDLVLLDLHLPDIDGTEILRELTADPDTSAIPVIVVTADARDKARREVEELGAAGFLAKPLDLPLFLQTVRGHLDGAGSSRDPSASRDAASRT